MPRGFEEVNFEHFRRSLTELWQRLTRGDPAELAAKLALELGSHHLASRWRTWPDDACLPPALRPMVNRVETAAALIQLAYDPSRGSNIMGVGPLQGFKIVRSNWDAQVFKPAFVILQNHVKPKRFWIVVRGTYSVEDIMTDITAEPERFMDGHVHKGILRSAEFLVGEIKACLQEHLPSTGKRKKAETADLLLVGHSLGAGAAALATAMLRIEQLQAKAIVFGAPSCVHRATYLENLLLRHVTHFVLDDDIIPRLNNETVTNLIKTGSSAASHLLETASTFVFNRLRDAVSDNRPLAKVLGVATRPTMQCPPGRNFLLQAHPDNRKATTTEGQRRWNIAELECHELNSIVLSPRMLTDHNVQSYVDAAQGAALRYLPVCGAARHEL
eukprot:Tamp_10932.p1 GENE.Tamp_10932~~Tamp_10932.p1  ORF type:complete len:425 (+),score=73.19 Tamp_10932:117-1277(+)